MKNETPFRTGLLEQRYTIFLCGVVLVGSTLLYLIDPLDLGKPKKPVPINSQVLLSNLEKLLPNATIPLSRDGKQGSFRLYSGAEKLHFEISLPYIDPERSDVVKQDIGGLVYEVNLYHADMQTMTARKSLEDNPEAKRIYDEILRDLDDYVRNLPENRRALLRSSFLSSERVDIGIIKDMERIFSDRVLRLEEICNKIRLTDSDFKPTYVKF